tara:strand:+ start:584 stop:1858 length:1275 start_codon:yes stop_codon:yes gene_type:complete
MEYAAAYENLFTETIFENIQSFNFTRDVIAGVYTVYPYVEIPDSVTEQQGLRRLLNKQLRYILDPAYHITVEVVAMEKTFGSRVFRNVHGRLIEKNLVEFNPIRTAYYNVKRRKYDIEKKNHPPRLEWFEIVPEAFPILFFHRKPQYEEDRNHPYIPKPNRDLISFASYDFPEGKEKTKVNKEITVCTSETGDIKASEHPYDPVLVNIDDRFGDIESKFVYGDKSYFDHAVNSMRLGFDDDYCFHKPGTIRFYAHRVTYCEVGFSGFTESIIDTFGGHSSDQSGGYNQNKRFEEGNYHYMTTCDYKKILGELNILRGTSIEEGTHCKTFTQLDNDGNPLFSYRNNHLCDSYGQTMLSSKIHNDGGVFPGFSDMSNLIFYTEYMLGFIDDADPTRKTFPTIYEVFLRMAKIHRDEDQGDLHKANK